MLKSQGALLYYIFRRVRKLIKLNSIFKLNLLSTSILYAYTRMTKKILRLNNMCDVEVLA